MVDREELKFIREEFGIDGLVNSILMYAREVADCYRRESEIRQAIRKTEREMKEMELSMLKQAVENGKNEAQRRLILEELKAQNEHYQRLEKRLEEMKTELEEVRAEREGAMIELNARRSLCYLLGSVLDAVHAQTVYLPYADEENIDIDEALTPSDEDIEEEPPF